MISQYDIEIIQRLSDKYRVRKVVLFGSSLAPQIASNDIDLAIEGIAPENYYRYCGELMMALTKPVDIIDLSVRCKFIDMILREGIVIYG